MYRVIPGIDIQKLSLILIAVFCMAETYAGNQVIQVTQSSLNPKTISATAGDTIQWVCISGKHLLRSKGIPAGVQAWRVKLNSDNKSYSVVLSTPGIYNYSCTFHGLPAKGKIVVNGVIQHPATATQVNKTSSDTSGIKLYPQPFKDRLTIDIPNKAIFKSVVTVEVYDALGLLKYTKNGENILQGPLTMDLSGLPAGYYLVNISDAVNKKTFRVLKAR